MIEISLRDEDGLTIAKIEGNLDETAKGPFRELLHPVVGKKGARLIVDLSGSARINSAGIGNLVALTADANTNDSKAVFCNLQPYFAMVIGVTKLDRYFEIVTDLAAAKARCSSSE
jgi:anti-anti-sigma factor